MTEEQKLELWRGIREGYEKRDLVQIMVFCARIIDMTVDKSLFTNTHELPIIKL